jgi:hypothetical protein
MRLKHFSLAALLLGAMALPSFAQSVISQKVLMAPELQLGL